MSISQMEETLGWSQPLHKAPLDGGNPTGVHWGLSLRGQSRLDPTNTPHASQTPWSSAWLRARQPAPCLGRLKHFQPLFDRRARTRSARHPSVEANNPLSGCCLSPPCPGQPFDPGRQWAPSSSLLIKEEKKRFVWGNLIFSFRIN